MNCVLASITKMASVQATMYVLGLWLKKRAVHGDSKCRDCKSLPVRLRLGLQMRIMHFGFLSMYLARGPKA
jgi:hypothetical protein